MQELVVLTWCDIHAEGEPEDDGDMVRVPGVRVHWVVDSRPVVVDLCDEHRHGITLIEMDDIARQYGHPDTEPTFESSGSVRRKRRRRSEEVVAGESKSKSRVREPAGAYENCPDGYWCRVNGCKASKPYSTLLGLKMHQNRSHGLVLG